MPFYKGWPGGPGRPLIHKDFYEALDKLDCHRYLEWPALSKPEVERIQQRVAFWMRKCGYTNVIRTRWLGDKLLIQRTV